MLETAREVANCSRNVRINGVALAARGCRMMRFVQNQQRAWPEYVQPIAQRSGIGLIHQQPVRNQKPRMRGPRVHAESALAPDILDVVLIQNLELQAETVLELFLPLQK